MFSKKKKQPGKSLVAGSAGQSSAAPSLISADLRMVGDLYCEGEIQVDGTIDGDIRSHILLVGQTAVVKGEIVADDVRIHGSVNGQIKGKNVSLARTAHVVGDILHENLSIENGAYLEGHCKRMEEHVDEAASQAPINLLIEDGTEDEPLDDAAQAQLAG